MNGHGTKLSEDSFRTLVHERLEQSARDHAETLDQIKSLGEKIDKWTHRVDTDLDETSKKSHGASVQAKVALAGLGIVLTALLAMIVI